MAEIILDLKGIRLNYGELSVLDNISMSMLPGEVIVIRGKSGSGKSSLARISSLLQRPTGGKVVFRGEDVTSCSEKYRATLRFKYIGYLDQHYTLIPTLSLRDNMLLPLKLRRTNIKEEDQEWFEYLVDVLKLDGIIDKKPSKVSGGQRQRAALVRALVKKPRLLVLDEPLSAQDTSMEDIIRELIYIYSLEEKAGVLWFTTELHGRLRHEKEVFLKDGRLVKGYY